MRLLCYIILFFLPVCLTGQSDFFGQKEEPIEVELQVTVYPNPTIDHFNITTNTSFSGSFTLSNMIGKRLTNGNIIPDQQTKVAMVNYDRGIYLLSVFDAEGKRVTTRKIFKE